MVPFYWHWGGFESSRHGTRFVEFCAVFSVHGKYQWVRYKTPRGAPYNIDPSHTLYSVTSTRNCQSNDFTFLIYSTTLCPGWYFLILAHSFGRINSVGQISQNDCHVSCTCTFRALLLLRLKSSASIAIHVKWHHCTCTGSEWRNKSSNKKGKSTVGHVTSPPRAQCSVSWWALGLNKTCPLNSAVISWDWLKITQFSQPLQLFLKSSNRSANRTCKKGWCRSLSCRVSPCLVVLHCARLQQRI